MFFTHIILEERLTFCHVVSVLVHRDEKQQVTLLTLHVILKVFVQIILIDMFGATILPTTLYNDLLYSISDNI